MSSDESTPLLKSEDKEPRLWWWCKFLLPPVLLFLAGTVFLCISEGWPALTSAYFATQVFTTIGYGDFVVKHPVTKVLVSLWAVVVLTFAAYAIGIIADMLMQSNSDVIRKHLRALEVSSGDATSEKKAKETYGAFNKLIAALVPATLFLFFGTVLFRYLEHCTCGVEKVAGCDDITFTSCTATGGYVKETPDAFYMSVMTLTTIGLGDFQPRTAIGRAIAIPWMFCGVLIFAHGITTLAAYFYENNQSEKMMAKEAVTSINKDVFTKIDRDGSGALTRGEFLAYSLLKYEVVSEELINEIFNQYDKFEGASGNRVTYDEIHQRAHHLLEKADKKAKGGDSSAA